MKTIISAVTRHHITVNCQLSCPSLILPLLIHSHPPLPQPLFSCQHAHSNSSRNLTLSPRSRPAAVSLEPQRLPLTLLTHSTTAIRMPATQLLRRALPSSRIPFPPRPSSRCLHLSHHPPSLHRPSSLSTPRRSSPSLSLRRSLYIQTQTTPNLNALKFLPGKPVLPPDHPTVDFSSFKAASARSPLASALFHIDGVRGVLLAADFISVNVEDGSDWNVIKPSVYAAIMDFYSSNQPAIKPDPKAAAAAAGAGEGGAVEEDSEVVGMIKELIETRIRPAVQEDGGDISFVSFNEQSGLVQVQMQGSCKGCSSSAVTLKNGIENMLMHYVPEVSSVEEWKDEQLEAVSNEELHKLEDKLNKIKHTTA